MAKAARRSQACGKVAPPRPVGHATWTPTGAGSCQTASHGRSPRRCSIVRPIAGLSALLATAASVHATPRGTGSSRRALAGPRRGFARPRSIAAAACRRRRRAGVPESRSIASDGEDAGREHSIAYELVEVALANRSRAWPQSRLGGLRGGRIARGAFQATAPRARCAPRGGSSRAWSGRAQRPAGRPRRDRAGGNNRRLVSIASRCAISPRARPAARADDLRGRRAARAPRPSTIRRRRRITACARLSEPNSGLIGTVTIVARERDVVGFEARAFGPEQDRRPARLRRGSRARPPRASPPAWSRRACARSWHRHARNRPPPRPRVSIHPRAVQHARPRPLRRARRWDWASRRAGRPGASRSARN